MSSLAIIFRNTFKRASPFIWALAASAIFFGKSTSAALPEAQQRIKELYTDCKIAKPPAAILSDKDLQTLKEKSGIEPRSINTYWNIRCQKDRVLTAYLDSHRLRSKMQALLIVLDDQLTIDRVEVVQFFEPRRYLLSKKWYQDAKNISMDPRSTAGPPLVAGATITSQKTRLAIRQTLIVHQYLVKIRGK